jgi:hypothetical protein
MQIKFTALALHVRAAGTAAVGTFDPVDAEPAQVLDHCLDEFRATALRIQIFVAEDQLAAMLGSAMRRGPKRTRMAEMEKAGGRGCKAAAVSPGRIGR